MKDHLAEIIIAAVIFLAVSAIGFIAARWRRPDDMGHLNEWGLGGRSFGSWITWFLVGGDLYTAYTFVAVPALLFASGALGFYAVPYTVIVYPMVFVVLVRLWSVSHKHGFVTPADFVRARSGSSTMALLVAITGIVATMPYIALQLVGIEAVLKSMHVDPTWALIIAFAILAAYTYQSGLRAPALIAFVKDALIYIVIIVAVIYIPYKLGGWHKIFDAADAKFAKTHGTVLNPGNQWQYVTWALGSALALFLYPHSITGVLASRSRNVIKRNMSALPAYSLLLGLIALLGYMAIAAQTTPIKTNGKADNNTVVPQLFDQMFPHWFAGVAFAAVAIGALVPAAIMSIAAANLFTRNIFKEYIKRDATPRQEAAVSKVASLVVKAGAVLVILLISPQFSIDLQLIGGVIILQTLPAVGIGLYTRWLHRWGLVAGWLVGMGLGVWMLYQIPNPATNHVHFGGSAFPLSKWFDPTSIGLDAKTQVYVGFVAVVANAVVAVIVTLICRALRASDGVDTTSPDDYLSDADSKTPPPLAEDQLPEPVPTS
ncbi:monocarboxylate uptake permease MctP [Rugosimonospora africana]|uniref:Solute:Na+ symporter, SSS family protein n=1 Tax=Rugosimonospora africana TaxID=556532 RepID=A0A8J3VT17_9ACTN|nr:sodium:solute symporter family protein [Rugosimonospora africana]GIH17053.1 solute:Na+ symporter, SSS family protein [Rugosimonospora africana]